MITISHTHTDGTLVDGTSRGDGTAAILKAARFRWFPSLGMWGIAQSRDRLAKTHQIRQAADALKAAGFDVTLTIDESQRRDFATAEAERCERAGERVERMAGYADNAAARSAAGAARADQILSVIPAGQPVLVGHHSEARHRRDLARADAGMRACVTEAAKAEHYQERAETAERFQERREATGTTLRRIEKLEAEGRDIQRRLDGTPSRPNGYYVPEVQPATGARRERLLTRQADITEEIAHWRGVIASQEASGVKVWSREDFTKGDYMRFGGFGTWYEVLRVSAKSVTIPAMINDGPVVTKANGRCTWTDTIPYHKVTGRKSAEDMAAIVAEADRRSALEPAAN